MNNNFKNFEFIVCSTSLKEAKRKFCGDGGYFIVDIGKIIRELGYDLKTLTKESEFVINYSIQKKISQGIYNTKNDGILIVHRNTSEEFVGNLKQFLDEQRDEFSYEMKIL